MVTGQWEWNELMANAPGPAPDAQARLAADWITIWQSEFAAMAQDREAAEAWTRFVGRAATAASRLLADAAPGCPGAASPPGSATAMAASDAALTRLEERVAALERGRSPGAA